MRYGCRRCDWRPEPGDDTPGPATQLADHAAEAKHPLCIVCARSLGQGEVGTCLPCIADARHRLDAIVNAYALLPGEFDRIPSPSDWRRNGPSSDETALPGGNALAMLAGGSQGRSQILGILLPNGERSTDHENDEHPGDPGSIAFELSRWEDDIRSYRGEPAATEPATVAGAARYLMARLTWIAETHPAFDEFTTELRRMLSWLATATATAERDDTGAACLDCGTDLRRAYAEARPCHHERPSQRLRVVGYWTDDEGRKHPIYETLTERDDRLAAWDAEHEKCRQGGREEMWRCPNPSCKRDYTDQEYRRAVAYEMRLKRDTTEHWVPLSVAARLVDRTQATVRLWTEQGDVETACDVKTRRLHVWLASVFRTDSRKARRGRAA